MKIFPVQWRAYVRLCKPGIVRMVGVTAAFAYFLAGPGWGIASALTFLAALLGIMASAAGSAALNNVLERDLDAQMDRTRGRELPQGTVDTSHALAMGLILTLGGTLWLWATVNLATAFLVLLTAFLYVLVYTPLKTRTWLNTTIGAIPGAMPMLCGWTAASEAGELGFGAWVLFAILFSWQHPHFYAIAWLYRDDYEKAGFQMLSVVDREGSRLFLQVILFSIMLVVVSVFPFFMGMTGVIYFWGAAVLGLYILFFSIRFIRQHNNVSARKLLISSILYLPALLVVMLLDRGVGLLQGLSI